MNQRGHHIPILIKAMAVLEQVAKGAEGASSAALARESKVSAASGYRILQTFISRQWVRLLPQGGYDLGPGLLPLARAVTSRDPFLPLYSRLEELARNSGFAAKLSLRRQGEAVTAFRAESTRPYAISVQAGTSFPLTMGASGAALCSGLSAVELERLVAAAPSVCWTHQSPIEFRAHVADAAKRGWTLDWGGYRPHIFGLSAPVRDDQGRVLAAATLVGLTAEVTKSEVLRWKDDLLALSRGLLPEDAHAAG